MFGRTSSHVIVRSHHPRLRQLFLVLLAVAIVVGGWQLFEYGRKRAGFDSAEAGKHRELLRNQISDLAADNSRLNARIVLLEQSSEIDHQAYNEVSRNLTELQKELVELRQEVEFYRGIVNAEDQSISGLTIQTLSLRPEPGAFGAEETRGYRFRLILSQIATTNARISGQAELVVDGMLDDEEFELAHDTLRFDLRHFQELRGSMTLPEGFEPRRVRLKVTPAGNGASSLERAFPWSELVS